MAVASVLHGIHYDARRRREAHCDCDNESIVTKVVTMAETFLGTLKRGDKGDYIWRTEQALGVSRFSALFHTALAARFPPFAKLLSLNSTLAGWAS